MKQEPETLTLAHDEAPASRTDKGVGSGPSLGGLDLSCEDCMALMARYPDKHFDIAIVDPPYGIGAAAMNLGKWGGSRLEKKNWDVAIPTPEYFAELRRVSREQIIWGGNYYPRPVRGVGSGVWLGGSSLDVKSRASEPTPAAACHP